MTGAMENKVDVCQTCLSNKAPQLPLREEILTQGFETVLLKSSNIHPNKPNHSREHDLCKDSLSDTKTVDEHYVHKVKRRQRRWKNAVSYERYLNPDVNSLATTSMDTENTSLTSATDNFMSPKKMHSDELEIEPHGKLVNGKYKKVEEMGKFQPQTKNLQIQSGRSAASARTSNEESEWYHSNHFKKHSNRTINMNVKHIEEGEQTKVEPHKMPDESYDNECGLLKFVDDACGGLLSSPMHKELNLNRPLSPKEKDERRMVFGSDDQTHGTNHSPIVSICGVGFQSPSQLKIALDEDPNMAKVMAQDGGLPLHAICKKGMTFRYPPSEDTNQNPCRNPLVYQEKTFIEDVLQDIKEDVYNLKEIMNIVLEAHPDGALIPNRSGDLPVHLYVRQIWAWEQFFKLHFLPKKKKKTPIVSNQSSCYHQVINVNSEEKDIKEVFHEVHFVHREIVQSLLKPLASCRTVCRAKGSQGTLLPIHIATLYGVKLEILQKLLQSYDEGASVYCSEALDHLQPKLPIELLQRHEPTRKKVLNSNQKQNPVTIFHQASDLIWMYNPNVLPFRRQPDRLQRIETLVRHHASSDEEILPAHAQRAWVFFNTFESEDSDACTDYSASVRYIINGLGTSALCKLLQLQSSQIGPSSSNFSGSGSGEVLNILDIANPTCKSILEAYRDELYMSKMVVIDKNNQSVLKKYGRYSNQERDKSFEKENCDPYVAQLCRLIFELDHDAFPSSFIILPYRLKRNADGGLELASKKDADVALKFAECLLDVSNAHVISYMLDEKKRIMYSSQDLEESDSQDDPLYYMEEKVKKNVAPFMSTYASSGTGYMYLLDEFRGVPVMNHEDDDESFDLYPLEVLNPTSIVPKVLPLMQMGMALMRGERGLIVLAEIVLFKSMGILPKKLYDKLELLVRQFQTLPPGSEQIESLKKDLLNFATLVYHSSDGESRSRRKKNMKHIKSLGSFQSSCAGNMLWDIELKWLELLFSTFDEKQSYAGLKKTASPFGGKLWSQSDNTVIEHENTTDVLETSEDVSVVTESQQQSEATTPYTEEIVDSAQTASTSIPEGMLRSPSPKQPPIIEKKIPVNFDAAVQLHDYHSDDPPRNLLIFSGKDDVSEFSTNTGFSEPAQQEIHQPPQIVEEKFFEMRKDDIVADNKSLTTGVASNVWSLPAGDHSLSRQAAQVLKDSEIEEQIDRPSTPSTPPQSNSPSLTKRSTGYKSIAPVALPVLKEGTTLDEADDLNCGMSLDVSSKDEDFQKCWNEVIGDSSTSSQSELSHSDLSYAISDGSRGDNVLMMRGTPGFESSMANNLYESPVKADVNKPVVDSESEITKVQEKLIKDKDDLLKTKELHIQELQDLLRAFDEEEKDLMREKEELIAYLEKEFNNRKEREEKVKMESVQASENSVDSKGNVKEVSNEAFQAGLMHQVHELEEDVCRKDEEIKALNDALNLSPIENHGQKDEKIASLLSQLSEREKELHYYEKALEQCVTEY